ncbi:MAG: hypothetical protein ACREVW_10170 [Burkholderiales bacterium]
MAAGDIVADHEELIRALYFPLWSGELKRATTIAYTQPNASVSRTAVLPYEEIVEIFKADLGDLVVGTSTITVQIVRDACAGDAAAELTVNVIADPVQAAKDVTANPAHAEIQATRASDPTTPVGLTKKIAKKILDAAQTRMI